MSQKTVTNIAISIRQKLLNRARERNQDFQLILTRYALERLLYRLSQSEHANEFILKGALLFLVWTEEPYRPTRDLDLLGFGESSTNRLTAVFRTLCNIKQDDGLIFEPESVSAEEIRGQQKYDGIRVTLAVNLEQARITLQIDVGFGDVVIPSPGRAEFPTILDMPPPSIRIYSKDSVIAEKYEAMVRLGIANSRMKDFCDVWMLSETSYFNGTTIAEAIRSTFARRKTDLPISEPIAFTTDFAEDTAKQLLWTAFVNRSRLIAPAGSLDSITTSIRAFLLPPTRNLLKGEPFDLDWAPGGPWKKGQQQ
jgi:predicted nucleotidyltransferase component of viral defense system